MGGFVVLLILGVFAIFAAGGSMIYVFIWWGTMFLFVYWIYRLCVRYDERKNKAYFEQRAKANEEWKKKQAEKQELLARMKKLEQEKLDILIERKKFMEKDEEVANTENAISFEEWEAYMKKTDKELKRISDEKLKLTQKFNIL